MQLRNLGKQPTTKPRHLDSTEHSLNAQHCDEITGAEETESDIRACRHVRQVFKKSRVHIHGITAVRDDACAGHLLNSTTLCKHSEKRMQISIDVCPLLETLLSTTTHASVLPSVLPSFLPVEHVLNHQTKWNPREHSHLQPVF